MKKRTGSIVAFLAFALATLLSACGGGGGSGDSSADARAVEDDLAALRLTLASGDSVDRVTTDFSVAVTGSAGSAITWSSNSPAIIVNAAGQVTVIRPAYDAADAAAELTATATKGEASDSRDFTLKVARFGQSDAEKIAALAMDKAAIAPSLAAGDAVDGVRHDFTVPVLGPSGSTITWASSAPAIAIDDEGNAVVTRPSSGDDLSVTLTATLANDVTSGTRTFVITVKEGSPPTRVAEDEAWVLANRVKIFGSDAPYQSGPMNITYFPVHADFTVPLVGPSGSTLTWSTVGANGRIIGIDDQGKVSLLHHPGFGTTIQDSGEFSFKASYDGYNGSTQWSNIDFSYRLTDPAEAVAWDRIVAGNAIRTAAQFPTPTTTTYYPYELAYPPATPGETRVVSHTTLRGFQLNTDLPRRSGTTVSWKSSDESVIAINNLNGAATVKPKATQQVVKLTAVFSKDGVTAESPYYLEITVPAAPPGPVIRYKHPAYQLPVGVAFDIAAESLSLPAVQCTVSPTLPAGLSMTHSDVYPCRIMGTPTVETASTLYTVTAKDALDQTGTTEIYLSVGPVSVTSVLDTLGVKPSAAPALTDRNGNPMPDDYNPLRRKNVSFFNVKELFGVGEELMLHGIYDNMAPDAPFGMQAPPKLMEFDAAANLGWMTNAVKSGAAGDLDGDGYDEVALIRLQENGAVGDVVIEFVNDKSDGYAHVRKTLPGLAAYFKTEGTETPGQVDVTAADIDGDGKDELIVGLGIRSYRDMPDYRTTGPNVWYASANGTAKLLVLDDADAEFALLAQKELAATLARSIYVAAADTTGLGTADQIAVSLMVGGEAKYYIYRYANQVLHEEAAGAIEYKEGDAVFRPMLADVVAADFNHNGVPEFVFAGVESPSEANPDTHYVAMAVERVGNDYVVLPGAKRWVDYTSGDWKPGAFSYSEACMESRTCDYIKVLDVFAEVLDVDGDNQPELLINNKVYNSGFNVKKDKFDTEMSVWGLMNNQNVGMSAYNQGQNPYWGYNPFTAFNRSNTWIAVGDFNGDHREDIAYWGRNRPAGLQVWGVTTDGAFQQLGWFDTGDQTNDNQNRNYPVLLGANVDDDSLMVSFNHSEVIFTEPMPIAAVAAAPCWTEGSGQNLEECTSSFGNSTGSGSSKSHTLSAHAAVSLGYQFPLSGLGIFSTAIKGTVEVNTEYTFGTEYSLTKSVMFNAGANEDMVVFSSIPYDIYHYDVVSTPVGMESLIGTDFVVRVPRKPRVQQAERSYYNVAVSGINANRQIGTETFTHAPGNPLSYPTVAQKNAIMSASSEGAKSGLEHGPVAVGQGGGSTVLNLDVSETSMSSTVLGFDVTVEVETTVLDTVSLGFAVGGGYASDVSFSTTEGTTYEGSIGNIDADNYAGKTYDFGIFAYTQNNHPSGFKFHTVNFWVD